MSLHFASLMCLMLNPAFKAAIFWFKHNIIAQVTKETVAAVFFNVEKHMGFYGRKGYWLNYIKCQFFNWIMDFFLIKEPSRGMLDLKSGSENGTPQRRMTSPILFSIMINDMEMSVSVI